MYINKDILNDNFKFEFKSGNEINIHSLISINHSNEIKFIELLLKELKENKLDIDTLKKQEITAIDDIKKSITAWFEIAEKLYVKDYVDDINGYNDLLKTKEKDSSFNTNNKWTKLDKDGPDYNEYISNMAYYFEIYSTEYIGKDGTPTYKVNYNLRTNSILEPKVQVITNINRRSFKDKNKMIKYINGRKEFFSRYFKELYPPIEDKYSYRFKHHGILLNNYRIL